MDGRVVVHEPSVVAISSSDQRIVAVGEEAQDMLGKTPDTLNAVRPIVGGVVADFAVTRSLLKILLARVTTSFQLLRPDLMLTVPSTSTPVERKATLEVALEAGAAHAYIVDAPLAAAIGAGIAVSSAAGNVLLHMGAEITETAVISLGGIVSTEGKRVGGNTINEAIKEYIRTKHNLVVGELTAETVKKEIASATELKNELRMEISGRDLIFGLPRTVFLDSNELYPSLEPILTSITSVVRGALERTPPELSSDVIDKGLTLTGGGARLRNFDKYLTMQTGIPAHLAEEPEYCAVRGAGVVLENLNLWRRSVTTKS